MNTKISQLIQTGEILFYVGDIRKIWEIDNDNTLYTTLKRYAQRGLLFRLYKGLYSLVDPKKISPSVLAMKISHSYSYMSTETILAEHGVIQQIIYPITVVSDISEKISVGEHEFIIRKLKDIHLYKEIGIYTENAVRKANITRAICDMLYFDPSFYFDAKEYINWKQVKTMQRKLQYPVTPHFYDTPKTK